MKEKLLSSRKESAKNSYDQAIRVLQSFETLSKNQEELFSVHLDRINGLKFLAEQLLKLYHLESADIIESSQVTDDLEFDSEK